MKSSQQCVRVHLVEAGVTTVEHILGIHSLQTETIKVRHVWEGMSLGLGSAPTLPTLVLCCRLQLPSACCQLMSSPVVAMLWGTGQWFEIPIAYNLLHQPFKSAQFSDILGYPQSNTTINTIEFLNIFILLE